MRVQNRLNKYVSPAANRFVTALDKATKELGVKEVELVTKIYFEKKAASLHDVAPLKSSGGGISMELVARVEQTLKKKEAAEKELEELKDTLLSVATTTAYMLKEVEDAYMLKEAAEKELEELKEQQQQPDRCKVAYFSSSIFQQHISAAAAGVDGGGGGREGAG